MSRISARDWLDLLLGSEFELLFDDIVGGDPLGFPGYRDQIERARATTGCSESVLVAAGDVDGARVIAISFEFGFLGGSMGVAAGERICRAFELAAREGIPVIALTASGGARMQEGMLALAQMPATLVARRKLAEARQPFIAYLRHPTTGGVYASFASSADFLWAEPGATIGFAGPRVAETFTGQALPQESHTAEWGAQHGLIHEVVEPIALRARVADVVTRPMVRERAERPPEPVKRDVDAVDVVRTARATDRVRASDLVVFSTASGGPITAGIGFAGGTYAIVLAQTKAHLTPRAYRTARAAIETAARLQLPIVTFIDTPGADATSGSEADGVAREISLTFESLLAAPVPTVACVLGEGGSGGALALAACDRLLIMERAFFSVIAPEGAATILKRSDVDQVARDLRLTAHDLRALGLADVVVPESGESALALAMSEKDVHAKTFLREAVGKAVAWAIDDAAREGAPTQRRLERWRVWQP